MVTHEESRKNLMNCYETKVMLWLNKDVFSSIYINISFIFVSQQSTNSPSRDLKN